MSVEAEVRGGEVLLEVGNDHLELKFLLVKDLVQGGVKGIPHFPDEFLDGGLGVLLGLKLPVLTAAGSGEVEEEGVECADGLLLQRPLEARDLVNEDVPDVDHPNLDTRVHGLTGGAEVAGFGRVRLDGCDELVEVVGGKPGRGR